MQRRSFIAASAGMLTASALQSCVEGIQPSHSKKITLLHTNDVHSHIDPFSEQSKYPNRGGVQARLQEIERIRQEQSNVFLFDCGDIFQGTPYFNIFKGDLEIRLMNTLRYSAATIGNHDFDAGLDILAKRIEQAEFPFVNSNYSFQGTALEGKVHQSILLEQGESKVGVYGLGIALEGLVPEELCKGITYSDPIEAARKQEKILLERGADLIVCLSHLGFSYDNQQISDTILAPLLTHTNVILGGHTHTKMDKALEKKNQSGHSIYINQAHWAGLELGCLHFEKKITEKSRFRSTAANLLITKNINVTC